MWFITHHIFHSSTPSSGSLLEGTNMMTYTAMRHSPALFLLPLSASRQVSQSESTWASPLWPVFSILLISISVGSLTPFYCHLTQQPAITASLFLLLTWYLGLTWPLVGWKSCRYSNRLKAISCLCPLRVQGKRCLNHRSPLLVFLPHRKHHLLIFWMPPGYKAWCCLIFLHNFGSWIFLVQE